MLDQALVLLIFLSVILSIFVNQEVVEFRYSNVIDIPYYISPLLGAFTLVFTGVLDLNQVYISVAGLPFTAGTSFLNISGPFSTILLFLSVAFVSLCLEVSGFFRYLAVRVMKMVNGSGRSLFIAVFWISGFLALFASNDIIILTLTPFLLEFLALTDLRALPYLIAEFFAANIFSMVLLIGNETNIIIATAHSLGFLNFAKTMMLPGFLGGLFGFLTLYLIFRDSIDREYSCKDLPDVHLNRWEILSSTLLIGTLFSLAFFSIAGFSLWFVGLMWVAVSFVLFVMPDVFEKVKSRADAEELFIYRVNRKMPWEVVPFLIGFFVMVHAFTITGITTFLTTLTSLATGQGLFQTLVGVGSASAFTANILNNIPMTVLFSEILAGYSSGIVSEAALYSLVIGSNVGAILSPIGALAGIMWMKMVNHDKRRITFSEFIGIGLKVIIPVLLASFLGLYIALAL